MFTGIILGGGYSSRFGFQDKNTQMFLGRTFLKNVTNMIVDTCESTILLLRDLDQKQTLEQTLEEINGISIIYDKKSGFGPFQALRKSIPEVRSPYVLVISVDIPQFPKELAVVLQDGLINKDVNISVFVEENSYLTTSLFAAKTNILKSIIEKLPYSSRLSSIFRLASSINCLSVKPSYYIKSLNDKETLMAIETQVDKNSISISTSSDIIINRESLLEFKNLSREKIQSIGNKELDTWKSYHIFNHIKKDIDKLLSQL